MENTITPALSFNNNVFITVKNAFGDTKKTVHVHNRCTRKMVSGLLRFLSGDFTDTNLNENAPYDSAKNYVPCFFNVGHGGVIYENGYPKTIPEHPSLPLMRSGDEEGWTDYVDYRSTKMEAEFYVEDDGVVTSERYRIRKQGTTITEEASDLNYDSIYFYCELPPGKLGDSSLFVSELGLFAGNLPGEDSDDLLAYVKLHTWQDEETNEWKGNTLFVKPEDTVIVNWVISIAAIGADNRFSFQGVDPMDEDLTSTVGELEFITVSDNEENGGN